MEDELGLPAGMAQPGAVSSKPASTGRFKYTPKSNPKPITEAGIDTDDLKNVVAQEMAQLKMFIKEVVRPPLQCGLRQMSPSRPQLRLTSRTVVVAGERNEAWSRQPDEVLLS